MVVPVIENDVARVAELHTLADLKGQSYIRVAQIAGAHFLRELFASADQMPDVMEDRSAAFINSGALLFYEPSTRTHDSFLAALGYLGARVIIDHDGMGNTSVAKGESFSDTLRSIEETTAAEVLILRHSDDFSSEKAVEAVETPVINAGSGKLHHPTQALLDAYTIYKELGELNGIHLVAVGDMLHGRTIKSLAQLLALGEGNSITFVAPESLSMPDEVLQTLEGRVRVHQTTDLEATLGIGDVFYWTRVQKERFPDTDAGRAEYNRVKDSYILTPDVVRYMRRDARIMHPLPRVNEIHREVDKDHRAVYFDQMRNGLLIRMALLKAIATGT